MGDSTYIRISPHIQYVYPYADIRVKACFLTRVKY